jgi:mannitol/fructose-specific phosphotransferase system IIA component (Ntr-type)
MLVENALVRALLTSDTVAAGLRGGPKEEVVERLVHLLDGHPEVRDIDALCEAVLARERTMSTAVGGGLALPHARTNAVRNTVAAFGVTDSDVEFDAIDGRPVRLVFLLAGRESDTSRHIRILSRVSRVMNEAYVREALLAADSPQRILETFERAEAALLEQ